MAQPMVGKSLLNTSLIHQTTTQVQDLQELHRVAEVEVIDADTSSSANSPG